MRKELNSGLIIMFLLVITFSFCVLGCGGKYEAEIQTEQIEDNLSIEKDSNYINEVSVAENNTPDVKVSRVVLVSDQIHLEQWKQLVEELKTTLGEIKGGAEQAR